jgi:glycerol kinase
VDLALSMQTDAGRAITQLRVDGGASANDLLLQMQADLLGVAIFRPDMVEATALGAAKLAARGAGFALDMQATPTARMGIFNPTLDPAARDVQLRRWRAAVAKV